MVGVGLGAAAAITRGLGQHSHGGLGLGRSGFRAIGAVGLLLDRGSGSGVSETGREE